MPEVSDLAAAGESFARASFPASPLDLAFLSELAPALFSVIVESVRPGEMAACRHWRVEAEVVETLKFKVLGAAKAETQPLPNCSAWGDPRSFSKPPRSRQSGPRSAFYTK
jgi:hypothetical protein